MKTSPQYRLYSVLLVFFMGLKPNPDAISSTYDEHRELFCFSESDLKDMWMKYGEFPGKMQAFIRQSILFHILKDLTPLFKDSDIQDLFEKWCTFCRQGEHVFVWKESTDGLRLPHWSIEELEKLLISAQNQ